MTMSKSSHHRLASPVAVFGALLVLSVPALAAGDPPALVSLRLDGIERATLDPRGNWALSKTLVLTPIEVRYSPTWDPRRFGHFGLSTKDIEKIRDDLSDLARKTFTETLSGLGFETADVSTPQSLEVQVKIIDLYVNAPPRSEIDPLYTYVFESGEMTLELEVRESGTGRVLATMRDPHREPGTGELTLSNEITQQAEARNTLREWARQLAGLLRQAGATGAAARTP